ncbi:uncharacterized protein LOC112573297 isoform X2 [Pomacea canaliculata]|uniref:uncharacterized protein LOC112573297 isoform X2 n=1 Tax=Pomacea canaliculata TaxID=400727 RepID=UPI000D725F0F|nr:uncharacterized protein LOC112573297 isoform X2 [Pomacea canaliculata]
MMSEDVIKPEMLSYTIVSEVHVQNLQCAKTLELPDVRVKTEIPEESGSGKGSQHMSDMTFMEDAGTVGMTQSQWTGLPERDLPELLIDKIKEEGDEDVGTVQLTTGETYRIKRCLSPTALESDSRRPRSAQVIQHDMTACSQMADQQHTTDFLALFGTDNMMLQEVTDMEQNVLIPGKCEDFDKDIERNEFAYQQLKGSKNDISDGEAMSRNHLDSSPGTSRKFSQVSSAEDDSSKYGTKWTDDLRCYPIVPPFTGEPGLKCLQKLGVAPSPLSFFQLFITDDVVKTIMEETNRYAIQSVKRSSQIIIKRPEIL